MSFELVFLFCFDIFKMLSVTLCPFSNCVTLLILTGVREISSQGNDKLVPLIPNSFLHVHSIFYAPLCTDQNV